MLEASDLQDSDEASDAVVVIFSRPRAANAEGKQKLETRDAERASSASACKKMVEFNRNEFNQNRYKTET